jgi:GTP-binding protein
VDHHAAHGGEGLSGPEADAAAAEAAGALLFTRPCVFLRSVAETADLPPPGLPEVAFAGRSNVGKSSLLNALVGRRDLARTSVTPGRTRTLNFYDLGRRLVLVDLPGYGHAEASRSAIRAWTALVDSYLRGRPNLRRACLLIDARRGLMEIDREVMVALDAAALVYQIVLTKADAVKPGALAARVEAIAAEAARRPACYPRLAVTSAKDGSGLAALRADLATLATPDSNAVAPGGPAT